MNHYPVIQYYRDEVGTLCQKSVNVGVLDADRYPGFEKLTRAERTKFLDDLEGQKRKMQLANMIESHQNSSKRKELKDELQMLKERKKGGQGISSINRIAVGITDKLDEFK